MITSKVLGENPYEKLTNAEFLKEFDEYMNTPHPIGRLDVAAIFNMCFLVEYDRRFRPKRKPRDVSKGLTEIKYLAKEQLERWRRCRTRGNTEQEKHLLAALKWIKS